MQKITAAQYWKNRMEAAKEKLPENMGQQKVIEAVAKLDPTLDKLTNANRWRNAWFIKSGDPEFTELVEKVANTIDAEVV